MGQGLAVVTSFRAEQIGCFSVGFAPKTAGELIDIAARLVVICVLALLTRLIVRFRKNLSIAALTGIPRRSCTDCLRSTCLRKLNEFRPA